MVRTLHQAGIEVILDVGYNHTAEHNPRGPPQSFTGIDNRAYSPVLREAVLPAGTTVPWWDGRQLHFEFA
jgi:hypothetical protein